MPNTKFLLIKRTLKFTLLIGFFCISLGLVNQSYIQAADPPCPPGAPGANCRAQQEAAAKSADTECPAPNKLQNGVCVPQTTNLGAKACDKKIETCISEVNPIIKDLIFIMNFLAAGVGIVVTLAIIIGGIRYMTAGANPQQLEASKKMIANALIALLVFGLMYSFLQWLIPGGVFHSG